MNQMTLAPLLVCSLLMPSAWGQQGDAEQQRAIAEIRKLGGTIQRDETKPGSPVVDVFLRGPDVTDVDLVHLEGLKGLKRLDLHATHVTDAGLPSEGLSGLEDLVLSSTDISDSGLAHLEGLTALKRLGISTTRVLPTPD